MQGLHSLTLASGGLLMQLRGNQTVTFSLEHLPFGGGFSSAEKLKESALWNSGQVMETGVYSLQTRNGGQKGFCVQKPHRVMLSIATLSLIHTLFSKCF